MTALVIDDHFSSLHHEGMLDDALHQFHSTELVNSLRMVLLSTILCSQGCHAWTMGSFASYICLVSMSAQSLSSLSSWPCCCSIFFFVIIIAAAAAAEEAGNNITSPSTPPSTPPSHILWSSTGGGWRAMFADVGYSNIFQQAGLLTGNSSRFSAVVSLGSMRV